MIYEPKRDRIRCPAGKYLYPNPGNYENRKRYVAPSGECRDCPLASTCPAKTRPTSPHTRFVLRPDDQDLFDEVQAQMQESTFLDRSSERMWKIEGLFAEAKQNHGLSRAKFRGRAKVQIQAYLCAIVQNLKRLLRALYCWLVACRLRWNSRSTHPQSANRSKPKSIHQAPAEIGLFQQARWFADTSHDQLSF